jgi:ELWxxDGT repeat protein
MIVHRWLLMLVLASTSVAAQTPVRIDLNSGAGPLVGSDPGGLFRAPGGLVYFSACTPEHGCELWRSDGSEAGTQLVKDIRPGANGSTPFAFGADANGTFVYFSADDGSHGRELWRSDGSASGTQLVADLVPGLDGSRPQSIHPAGGNAVVFTAVSNALGRELYRSSGSSIELVIDLLPGVGSGVANNSGGVPDLVAVGGNRVVFAGAAPGIGTEPFISDGTAAGTQLIRDIAAGGSSSPFDFVPTASGVAFIARTPADGDELYLSDFTSAGTQRVSQIAAGSGNGVRAVLGLDGATIFLAGSNGSNGVEPYAWNGSAIVQLAEIAAGSASSLSPNTARRNSAVSAGLLYFPANAGASSGEELWRSNGSAVGTVPVIDLVPGSGSSEPRQMTPISNGAFTGVLFVSNLGSGSSIGTLHRSDGTAIGTVTLSVRKSTDPGTEMIVTGSAGAQSALMSATDDIDALDRELWRSDTSLAGTTRVKDIASHQGSSLPSTPVIADKRAWFAAYTPATGFELYVSQGNAASTAAVSDLRPGPASSLSQSDGVGEGRLEGIGLGELLVYFADAPGVGYELHVSNGSVAGTQLLADLSPGADSSFALAFARAGNRAFVLMSAASQLALVASNGSPAGTTTLSPGCAISDQGGLQAIGNQVYFLCEEASFGRELYRVDADTLAVQRVIDLTAGPDSSSISLLGRIGNPARLLFADEASEQRLFVSDGSAAGTTLIHTAPAGSSYNGPAQTDVAGNAWLPGSDGTSSAWFRIDRAAPHALTLGFGYSPSGTTPDGDRPSLANTGCSILAKDAFAGEGMELLRVRTDNQTGAILQPSLQPGLLSATPDGLLALPGVDAVVTSALSGTAGADGVELLRLGFVGDTRAITHFDLAAGAASSSPRNFAALGSSLLFSAHTATNGRELYLLPPPDRIFADDFTRGCGLPPL